jgi:hypothetical protein
MGGGGSDYLLRSVMPLSTMSVTSVIPLLRSLSLLWGHWVQYLWGHWVQYLWGHWVQYLWGHWVQCLSRLWGVQISALILQHFLSVRISQNSNYWEWLKWEFSHTLFWLFSVLILSAQKKKIYIKTCNEIHSYYFFLLQSEQQQQQRVNKSAYNIEWFFA